MTKKADQLRTYRKIIGRGKKNEPSAADLTAALDTLLAWSDEIDQEKDANIASMQQHILDMDKHDQKKDEEIARLRGVLETVLLEASLANHFTDMMYVGLPIKIYELVAKTLEGGE